MRVMLRSPSWRPRIAEHLEALPAVEAVEWKLLTMIAHAAPDVSGGELLEEASPEARTILAGLLAEPAGDLAEDATVDGALRKIESRALEERLRQINRRIIVASDEEKAALTREKETLSREISTLNPSRWNVIKKGRSGSAR
jgi:hypothetical protein